MNPPANWYPDPTGRHNQRYWDGEQWTEHVFTDGEQRVDPLDEAAPAQEDEATAQGSFDTAEDASTWTPEEQDGAPTQDADSVAPEVEPEDVVGNLDEVAADTIDDGDAGDRDDGDQTPADDFADAFMVTPETVSRLVGGQASTEPQTADEPAPAAAAPVAEEPVAEEPVAEEPGEAAAPGEAATDQGLGISGDLVGGAFAEREEAGPVSLQNSRLLRCSLGEGPGVIARQGTMVAYQGDISFARQGAGGVTRALKRAATGEGLAMMRAEGAGDVFFADGGQHAFLLHLDGGPGLSVNGRNVLAFSAALQWDIERVKGATLLAGGLFNTTLTGTGWVALVSDGEPVVLRTDEAPTYVDVNALVAWSAGVSTRVTNTVTAKSLVGLGSGEAFQMAFDGAGIVIVQPSEGRMGAAATT